MTQQDLEVSTALRESVTVPLAWHSTKYTIVEHSHAFACSFESLKPESVASIWQTLFRVVQNKQANRPSHQQHSTTTQDFEIWLEKTPRCKSPTPSEDKKMYTTVAIAAPTASSAVEDSRQGRHEHCYTAREYTLNPPSFERPVRLSGFHQAGHFVSRVNSTLARLEPVHSKMVSSSTERSRYRSPRSDFLA